MDRVATRGEADELARFRRISGATILATFALILIGGVVRVSDSGLGCGAAGSGTHGWPLCGGGLLPGLESTAVIEFSHRVAATVVTVLIALLIYWAWRRVRDRGILLRGSIAAGVLVLAQAGLGGLTVEKGLDEYLVAAHLCLAMLLLGLLIVLRREAQPELNPPANATRGLRVLTWVSAGLVLATIFAGGLIAGTEGEGRASEPLAGAHTACGEQFPGCANQGLFPFGNARLIDIQLAHRALMYLATIAIVATALVALWRRVRAPAIYAAVGVLGLQILLGVANVLVGEHAGLIVSHLAAGTLLWATAVYAGASLLRAPAARSELLDGARAPAGVAA